MTNVLAFVSWLAFVIAVVLFLFATTDREGARFWRREYMKLEREHARLRDRMYKAE